VLWYLPIHYNNYDVYSHTDTSALTVYVVGLRPSISGTADSNLKGDMDVSIVSVVCCQVEVPASGSSHSYRALSSVVCMRLSVAV